MNTAPGAQISNELSVNRKHGCGRESEMDNYDSDKMILFPAPE